MSSLDSRTNWRISLTLSLALNSASRDGILVPSYLEGFPLLWKIKFLETNFSSFSKGTLTWVTGDIFRLVL